MSIFNYRCKEKNFAINIIITQLTIRMCQLCIDISVMEICTS